MPFQIYRRQNNPDDILAQAIMAGTQGFVQGRQLRQQNDDKSLANALMISKIAELQRKNQAQVKPGYFVDSVTGKQIIDRSPETQGKIAKAKARAQFDAFSDLFGGGKTIPGISGEDGNYPPGTTMRIGPLNIPLNPKLTGDEAASLAAKEVFNPLAEGLKRDTQAGVFNSKFSNVPVLGNVARTYRQYAVGQPNALLTSHDPRLQVTQGKVNSIRRYIFGEGGKQLTPYEANIVNALIKPTGKSDIQYQTDLDEAIKLINSKAKLALGGARAANRNSDNLNALSDDELRKLAGV